jgi:hypothetical protein
MPVALDCAGVWYQGWHVGFASLSLRSVHMTDSLGPEPVHITMTEAAAVLFGMDALDDRARQHLHSGRVAEAADEYTRDIEATLNVVAAVDKAGAEVPADVRRAVDERVAHALHSVGQVEAVLLRTRLALEHTAEGLRIYRELDRESVTPRVRRGLADALASFAFARASSRLDIAEAAEAVAESVRIMEQLTARTPGPLDAELGQRTRLRDQIGELQRRDQEGEPLGVAGAALPDGPSDWRETLYLKRFEQLEVSEMLDELSADQVEAFLRGLDARGDAEGARKLGVLRNARGDHEEGEAALRRGDERGSPEAPFYLGVMLHERGESSAAESAYRRAIERGNHLAAYNLGQLLRSQGNRDGAREAFERAIQSDDAELVADAQRMLRKVSRTRWLRRSPRSDQ